jgi:alpha-tubulin suppressor-like RCC1 family protein
MRAPERVQGIYEGTGIVMGGDTRCAVMKDGWLRCWGPNDKGQLADGTTEARSVPTPIRY